VQEADRIILAYPESNTQSIVGLEGAYNRGSLHLQAEAFYSQYRGRVDGYGGGGYLQLGWFLTGETRDYNPRWGILAPHTFAGKFSTEVFARVSHTRGDDDIIDWNDYKSVTLGANLYFRSIRCSLNVLYGESREPIGAQSDGLAFVVRAQTLF